MRARLLARRSLRLCWRSPRCSLIPPLRRAPNRRCPPGFQDEVVFDGLEQPTNFALRPRRARLRRREAGADPRLRKPRRHERRTSSPTCARDVYDNGDRGLLGLALDPEFADSGPTSTRSTPGTTCWANLGPGRPEIRDPGRQRRLRLPEPEQQRRLPGQRPPRPPRPTNRLSPNHAVEAGGRPKQEQLLEGWCQQFSSHSVGELQFGPGRRALRQRRRRAPPSNRSRTTGQLGNADPNPCGDPPDPAGTAPSPLRSPGRGAALRRT